jgi:hypothetical protein
MLAKSVAAIYALGGREPIGKGDVQAPGKRHLRISVFFLAANERHCFYHA